MYLNVGYVASNRHADSSLASFLWSWELCRQLKTLEVWHQSMVLNLKASRAAPGAFYKV